MSILLTYILVTSIMLYFFVLIFELMKGKYRKSVTIQLILLLLVIALLNRTTGFPEPRISFGSVTPWSVVLLMFLCIIFGMIANYFYKSSKFSLYQFIKPFCISPIVLMPLVGTIEGIASFGFLQILSLCLIAFQNGFFWKDVFEKPRTKGEV